MKINNSQKDQLKNVHVLVLRLRFKDSYNFFFYKFLTSLV